jgi:tyrosinase
MAVGATGTLRTRHDVWKLPAGDTTLEWYGKAVTQLKTLPISTPTSWRYQAAIHDYNPATDPLRSPSDITPADAGTYWAQCQHGCSYFLPWHRAYLFYFEQLIAATVVALGGPAGWSLPYWNYSDSSNPRAGQLPPAFYTPAGSANPLYITQRSRAANRGRAVGDHDAFSLNCLVDDTVFFGADDGSGGGFGGLNTGSTVHGGSGAGGLESVPHNTVHGDVGGPTGWMSAFNTAGLDPIFWLHHSNIDRLWEVWLRRDPSHQDPPDTVWLGQVFQFHDATGAPVTITPQQVLDTTAAPLSYQYEDVSDPFATSSGSGA